MIGQEKLLNTINSYTLQTLPKTILLLGEEGCGKKTLTNLIAKNLNLELIIVDKNVTHEDLIEFNFCPIRKLYLIDLNLFTERQQNQLLKFIEEPSNTVNIILVANSEIGILPTILNRCIKLTFEAYTSDQLKLIKNFNDNIVYKICKTPGQLLQFDYNNMADLIDMCKELVLNIDKINYAKILMISTKINYKEEYDKFEFYTFLNALAYVAQKIFKKTKTELSFKIYNLTTQARQILIHTAVNKENFILHLLSNIWEEAHK